MPPQVDTSTSLTFATAILSGGKPYEPWKEAVSVLPGYFTEAGRSLSVYQITLGCFFSASLHLSSHSRCVQKWSGKHSAFRCKECGITPSSCICVACFNASDHTGHTFTLYQSTLGCDSFVFCYFMAIFPVCLFVCLFVCFHSVRSLS